MRRFWEVLPILTGAVLGYLLAATLSGREEVTRQRIGELAAEVRRLERRVGELEEGR